MTAKTMKDLFIHALSGMYSAEKQRTKGLPKVVRAAPDTKLTEAFQNAPGRDAKSGRKDFKSWSRPASSSNA